MQRRLITVDVALLTHGKLVGRIVARPCSMDAFDRGGLLDLSPVPESGAGAAADPEPDEGQGLEKCDFIRQVRRDQAESKKVVSFGKFVRSTNVIG